MGNSNKQLHYYRLTPPEVLAQLGSHRKGLTSSEAKNRLSLNGQNQLVKLHHESSLLIFIRQFKNLLVIMLVVSGGLSVYLKNSKTAIILFLIALMNTLVGFFQEHKAETLLKSLEKLIVPQAKVLRDGRLEQIKSTELVLGDIVYVEEGDSVPADLRVLEETELSTNDFALTGESNPSRKFVHAINGDVPLSNRHNLLFMSTTVATGQGYGVVIGVGMNSELGRIASLSQATVAEASPLQKEMNHLAKRLAEGTVILAAILTVIALRSHLGIRNALLFGIAIGAAMIPNGLVAEVSITLAQSAAKLAKAKALVKKLSAVETLGATNFILTDKTGTLTKNEMTVTDLLIGKKSYTVSGTGYEAKGGISLNGQLLSSKELGLLKLFFETATLSSNAKVDPPDDEHPDWYVVGDPTEGALITLVRKAGLNTEQTAKDRPELKEFQFDSARKLLSSVRRGEHKVEVFTKGAPESLLERSKYVWDGGKIRKMTENDQKFFENYNEAAAKEAKRNLALGYRVLPEAKSHQKYVMNEVEQDFVFLGIVSMIDPLRDDVRAAMQVAHQAHVQVSIVTGDFPTTAKAIATQAGLSSNITIVLGDELPKLADTQVSALVEKGGAVFSRVAPEDKLRIVDLVKKAGYVVAVTGDGINDAPAIKRADIGVAMGKTGTDVAKNAADIVLLDDSFNTLVGAIEQGRLTYKNIKKAARCALTDNAGELFTVLIGLAATSIFGIAPAITAIQILAIDVVAQIMPITALGWDAPQENLMTEKPRRLADHIINLPSIGGFIWYGFIASLLSYLNFLYFFKRHGISLSSISSKLAVYPKATTLTYLTLVLCLYSYLLFERSDRHEEFLSKYLYSNKRLLLAFGGSFFLIANIVYNPLVQPYFNSASLSFRDWLSAIGCALIYTLMRLIFRIKSNSRFSLKRTKISQVVQTL